MQQKVLPVLLLIFMFGCAATQQADFKREGEGAVRVQKDALENKPPPYFN